MPKANDEPKSSKGKGIDRRTVIKGALAVGGASVLAGAAAATPKTAAGTPPQVGTVAEREWARALARHIVNQLPEAIRQLPDLQLTDTQVQEIQRAFQNTLVTNMGCEVPPS